MADRIITVTNPSVVTNDTLASYNNYSDVDGLLGSMTPTEGTNGKTVALSDGSVHEVTTKPVGTTNGEFAAVISNAVTVDLSGGGGVIDISASTDATEAYDVSAQVPANLTGVFIGDSGTKMYVLDSLNDSVWQYTLSTPYDVTSASYASKTFDFTTWESNTHSINFSTDGSKMFVLGYAEGEIQEYTLSTPWDVTTATYVFGFNVEAQDSFALSHRFNTDGTKVYMSGNTNRTIFQYDLSVAWDITSATYASKSFNPSNAGLAEFVFSEDGTQLIFVDKTNFLLIQCTLSVAWDIASAAIDSPSNTFTLTTNYAEIYMVQGQSKLYVGSADDAEVKTYNLN